MIVLKAQIFEKYPRVLFGFGTKIGPGEEPFYFNVSLSVGDDEARVKQNRELLFKEAGLALSEGVMQRQTHSDIVTYVEKAGMIGESDAMITDKPGIGLAVSTADCTPIFIYDKRNIAAAGIHSGWRGTAAGITQKALEEMRNRIGSKPDDLVVYIGPSVSQINYEVGREVAEKFDSKYLIINGAKDKYLLDVAGVNYDVLLDWGVPKDNIQRSNLCTYEMQGLLHSYRRAGVRSGRALGIIGIKRENE